MLRGVDTSTDSAAASDATTKEADVDPNSLINSRAKMESNAAGAKSLAVLPTIIFAQFAGTSLWFAPNAVASQIDGTGDTQIATLTSLVQVGFIVGTFGLTYLNVADRFRAEVVFAVMCALGSLLNFLCVLNTDFVVWATLRTLVGVCLAGVFPVGMKIAAKQYPHGLGARLGLFLGASTLGTAFPWLLRGLGNTLPFEMTLLAVSVLSLTGGALLVIVLVPWKDIWPAFRALLTWSTPAHELQVLKLGWASIKEICSAKDFRAAAMGYFGHCWELYAWWTYVPNLIEAHEAILKVGQTPVLPVAMFTFFAMAIGAVACAVAGVWALWAGRGILPGSAVVANLSLATSMCCCFLAPLYQRMTPVGFFVYIAIWGWSVVADSGQFAALLAQSAPHTLMGTALTLATCIGFSVTVVGIQVLGAVLDAGVDPGIAFVLLGPGPVIGLFCSYSRWPVHRVVCKERGHTFTGTEPVSGRRMSEVEVDPVDFEK
ncbi:Hypothetical Protein FCC1311_046492 [Hondaea fermentalgiana]|uniref:Uncharacterized protein n=1 Tax=Hondaea fermentalgiana TaxID=2315210 RepID=A0A2R5GBQ4_9STRA|nr:Hypothetical Protein FCC1311_046492 [Hondaea fermentalgiana]|eukprot:GBG28426.1 Hypothetical Protein FCC1311_046492 [Hondaea fermentalgiana]